MTSCHGLWVDLSSVIGLHTGSQTTHKMSTQLDRMEEQLQKLLKVAVENRILEKWILAGVIVCIALLVRHSSHDVALLRILSVPVEDALALLWYACCRCTP